MHFWRDATRAVCRCRNLRPRGALAGAQAIHAHQARKKPATGLYVVPGAGSGTASGQQRHRLDNLVHVYIKRQACRVSSGTRFAQSSLYRGFVFASLRQQLRCVPVGHGSGPRRRPRPRVVQYGSLVQFPVGERRHGGSGSPHAGFKLPEFAAGLGDAQAWALGARMPVGRSGLALRRARARLASPGPHSQNNSTRQLQIFMPITQESAVTLAYKITDARTGKPLDAGTTA